MSLGTCCDELLFGMAASFPFPLERMRARCATNEMTVRPTPHAATAVGGELPPLAWSGAAEAGLWEEHRLCSRVNWSSGSRVQQYTTLEQREACLSIRTAFDPLQFVVESLHHPVAPRFGASVGDRLRIIGQAIGKADQFLGPRGAHCGFPLVQPALAFPLARASGQSLALAYRRLRPSDQPDTPAQ